MKRIKILAAGLIFGAALLFSLAIAVKPGAAVFYLKLPLANGRFQHDSGYAYRYHVNLSPKIFPPEKILVFEDGRQLSRDSGVDTVNAGNGRFTTDESDAGGFYLYIAPTGNGDPNTNGRSYRIYSANIFFSQTMGIVYFSILAFVFLNLAADGIPQIKDAKPRRPDDFLQIGEGFLAHLKTRFYTTYQHSQSPWKIRFAFWSRLLMITGFAAYALIFWEWLFQATRSSFMDGLGIAKIEIFLLSGLALTAASVGLVVVLLLVALILRPLRINGLAGFAAGAVPAALVTALVLLGLDSFTYTLFRYGILTASGLPRTAYGVASLLIFLSSYAWFLRLSGFTGTTPMSQVATRRLRISILVLLAISAVLALVRFNRLAIDSEQSLIQDDTPGRLPNILLIGSDGVNAQNMSLYGYQRDTTPQILELSKDSLVAENAFTNAGNTHGSIVSIFTSKLPTRTGVIYPPDILQGEDAYQHLPGILKNLGYRTIQAGVSPFVDAYNANLQDGFDKVNQRVIQEDRVVKTMRGFGYDLPALLILTIEERLANRLFQALYIDTIENPFSVINDPIAWRGDRTRLNNLTKFIENTNEPVFAHVHFMVTHGAKFTPHEQVFSAGQSQDRDWMVDFYDDAILTYDGFVAELIVWLQENDLYDRTILILYSDHAIKYQSNERVPLLFHFPNGEHNGRIPTNVQNLDIAPTILDYLGISIPDWMEGQSLLRLDATQKRPPIFSATTDGTRIAAVEAQTPLQADVLNTSNFQLSTIQVVDCQRWYTFDIGERQWDSGLVPGHTDPCRTENLLSEDQISAVMVQFLAGQGYDASVVP